MTWGEDFFQLEKGGKDFFSEKNDGTKTFFRVKKGGGDFVFR